MGRDRRRYPRVGVVLDVIVEAASSRWQAHLAQGNDLAARAQEYGPHLRRTQS